MVDRLRAFQPDPQLRRRIIDAIRAQADRPTGKKGSEQRRQLLAQLEQLRDLYLLGEFTKDPYVMRRQALEEAFQRTDPPTDPHLDRAQQILEDFAGFWTTEPEASERRKLLAELFQTIW